jgi:hypothetical protein
MKSYYVTDYLHAAEPILRSRDLCSYSRFSFIEPEIINVFMKTLH